LTARSPRLSAACRAAPAALAGALAGFLARDLGFSEIASAWVPGALLGALLSGARLRAWLFAGLAVLGVLWFAVAFTPVAKGLSRGLVRREAPQPADAVVVLASRLQADGELTAASEARLLRAAELLRGGWATRLVLTELPAPVPSHAAAAATLLERLGVAGELVSVGPVRRTRDEALRVAALCRERGWRRLLVVTSPLHSRRASAALERQGLRVVSCPSRESLYDLETLDRPRDRLLAFGELLHEWAGLWLYARRGWSAPARESAH